MTCTKLLEILREPPRGLYLVALTGFWERSSYWWSMLFVPFLTDAPKSGGFSNPM